MNPSRPCRVGVIVTFCPSDVQLANTLSISKNLDFLYIVDNSEPPFPVPDLEGLAAVARVKVLHNGNAGGIAGALNLGCLQAVQDHGDCHIFLLDQDSCLPPGFFDEQQDFALRNRAEVVAPRYFDINSKSYGNYTRLTRWRMRTLHGEAAKVPFEVTFAINSGTMIWSPLLVAAGRFKDDYFIDHVDSEFCIRLQKLGHQIIINPDVVFNHAIGKRIKRKFLGVTLKPNFHPAYRRYYAVRNGVFMVRGYFSTYPSILLLIFLRIGYEYAGILLYENQRWSKVKALWFGLLDGLLGRKGRCVRSF